MCRDCLKEILPRVKETDALILITLRNKPPQYGLVMDDIQEELDMKRCKVYESINRLHFVGAIDYLKENRCNKYFITSIGKDILELLDEQFGDMDE